MAKSGPSFEKFQEELAALVARFAKDVRGYTGPDYSEARLRDDFLNPLFAALGWDISNRAGLIQSKREVEIESRTRVGSSRKRADYLFRTDGRDRFVCEAKKPREELGKAHIFQAKRYAWNKDLPFAVLTDFEEMKFFIVGSRPNSEEPAVGELKSLHYTDYEANARYLWDHLSRESVGSGFIDRLIDELPKKAAGKGRARQGYLIKPDRNRALDVDFLNFLDEARRELASSLFKHNDRELLLADGTLNAATQKILDRILFLRICEDRDIDTGARLQSLVETWEKSTARALPERRSLIREEPASRGPQPPGESLYRVLVNHFRELDRRPASRVPFFNGQLFKKDPSEDLEVGDDFLVNFIGDLSDENSPYLFNAIPVEILGSVYERFLGKVVRLQGRGVTVEEKPEVRKAGGVYYTPRYIVDYIVEQTVGKLLDEAATAEDWKTFTTRSEALRFLDPACGSGSFLIRVFERTCEHWEARLTRELPAREDKEDRAAWEKKHRQRCWVDRETNAVHLTVELKRRILTSNIYGVDLDAGAVEVTQLSLYLKMLEGENSTTLQRQRDLLPDEAEVALLPPLQDNIKHGNSLIASDFSMVPEDLVRVHAFDWPVQFAHIMKAGGFDAVVGNPPYIPIETMEDEERAYYQQAYSQLQRKYDTGVIFILQALRLIKPTGSVGYISSITWETGENFSRLREVMFTKHGVSDVINLPFNTFADAYVDTGVYILCGKPTPEYRIFRFAKKAKIDSLKNIDPITVSTSLVTAPDFRLVLDPNAQQIIVRAASSRGFKALGELTKSTQGLAADRYQRGATARSPEWYPFGERVQAYRYDFAVEEQSFAYMKDSQSLKQFYEAEPKLLIRRIINRKDRLDVCFCNQQMVFKKDINPFVLTVAKPSPMFLLAVLNSRLISYLYVNTSAIATKDDFRQTTLAELRRLPIPCPDLSIGADRSRHDKLVSLVDKMMGLVPKLRAARSESEKATLQNAVSATDQQIDALVYELYGLTDEEIALVEADS